ncbi:MAG: hypothetical protein ACRD3C_00405 [Vicinamibacterales bacterium]
MMPAAAQDTAHYGVWSDLVVLHATVMNGDGAYVRGLPETSFRAFHKDEPQTLDFFREQDTPARQPGQPTAADIRSSYMPAYAQPAPVRNGERIRLRVEAYTPDGRSLEVRTRPGYVATSPSTASEGGAP